MKRVAFALAVWLVLAGPSLLQAEDGVIDLAALPDFSKNSLLITNTGATLGRVLFYDKRLSRNNTVSCSSCHQQAYAFGNPAVAGTGVAGMTSRHPMRLANVGFSQAQSPGGGVFFWDRRAPSLESTVTQPIRNAIEMGFSGTNGDPDFAELIAKLSVLPEYQLLFSASFGSPVIDETGIQKALSQFIRTIYSLDSKFDAGVAKALISQPFPNFSESENRGKQLYMGPPSFGGAGCAFCHQPDSFANTSRGNNGVITSIGGGTDLTVTNSGTLRDLIGPSGQLNGPLMHNGAFNSIAQVIDHYTAIPGNPNLDPGLGNPCCGQTLSLTPQQRLDLEAFLLTLSSNAIYTDPKWSNPFRADGTITVKDSAPPASQTVNLSTRMQVLTGDKVGIGGFIITGTVPKRVLVRALGPSLAQFGLSTLLADPTITLHGPDGFAPIVNDSWKSSQQDQITATGLAPGNDLEPAIVVTLAPGGYTAVLSGVNGGTGTGILEIYDLDFAADSKLGNISTRAFAGTGDDILIAGFTVGKGSGVDNIIIRGLGPSLESPGLLGQTMFDPTLEVRNADGTTLVATDGWQGAGMGVEVNRAGLLPQFTQEPVAFLTLGPGAYTALLSPSGNSFPNSPAIALIEIYSLGRLP
ncbi:MAG TPA: cytochrome c peroxidase [Chthoniobacterales bacterium]|nr:cytochrome c peroxidase [Chthoniobacterales bacterium]